MRIANEVSNPKGKTSIACLHLFYVEDILELRDCEDILRVRKNNLILHLSTSSVIYLILIASYFELVAQTTALAVGGAILYPHLRSAGRWVTTYCLLKKTDMQDF